MSLTNQFGTNAEKEIEGVEVQYGANDDGSVPTFILSRMGKANKRYTKLLEAKTKPYRRAMELGTMSNDLAESLVADVFAETVLKGWRNVKLSDVSGEPSEVDGADAPFTKDNALKLFKRLPELFEDLQEKAKSAALFRDESLEEEAKN